MKKILVSIFTMSVFFLFGCTQAADPVVEEETKKEENISRNILLNKESLELKVGTSFQLKADVYPASGAVQVSFTSDKSEVASVNSSGYVTGNALGDAVITVSLPDGTKKACSVKVVKVLSSTDPEEEPSVDDSTKDANNDTEDTNPVVVTGEVKKFVFDFSADGFIFDGMQYACTVENNTITKTDAGNRLVGSSEFDLEKYKEKFITVNFFKENGSYFLKLKSGKTGLNPQDYELVSCTESNETNCMVYSSGQWLIWTM